MKSIGFIVFILSFYALPSSDIEAIEIISSNRNTQTLIVKDSDGGELFNKYCSDCHAINEEVYGPALNGVEGRRDKEWIINFVLDQEKFIKTDSVAAQMYQASDELHPTFSSILTSEQIKEILKFILAESKN